MSVLVVGISHKSAPVALLERVALDADGVHKLLRDVAASEHVTEATVIATCNRVEIYAEVDRFHGSVEEVSRLLVDRAGESTEAMLPHLYVHYDDGAVSHLFQVAAGLDSMAVGEGQILGQTRDALRRGQEQRHRRPRPQRAVPAGAAGRQALPRRDRHRPGRAVAGQRRPRPGRRRRSAASPASACWSSAPARWPGSPTATVARGGAAEVTVVNRTADHADRLAREYGARSAPLADLAAELGRRRPRDRLHRRHRRRSSPRATLPTPRRRRRAARGHRPRAAARRRPGGRRPARRHPVGLADLADELRDTDAGREVDGGPPDRRPGGRGVPLRPPAGQRHPHRRRAALDGHRRGRRRDGSASPPGCPTSTRPPAPRCCRPCAGSPTSCSTSRPCGSRSSPTRPARSPTPPRSPSCSPSTPRPSTPSPGPEGLHMTSVRPRGSAPAPRLLATTQAEPVADADARRPRPRGRAGRDHHRGRPQPAPPLAVVRRHRRLRQRAARGPARRRVDVAVHSLKDLPTYPADGIALAAVPRPRGPARRRRRPRRPHPRRAARRQPGRHRLAAPRRPAARPRPRLRGRRDPRQRRHPDRQGPLAASTTPSCSPAPAWPASAGSTRRPRCSTRCRCSPPPGRARWRSSAGRATRPRRRARARSTTRAPGPRSRPSGPCSPRSRAAARRPSARWPRSSRATTGTSSGSGPSPCPTTARCRCGCPHRVHPADAVGVGTRLASEMLADGAGRLTDAPSRRQNRMTATQDHFHACRAATAPPPQATPSPAAGCRSSAAAPATRTC